MFFFSLNSSKNFSKVFIFIVRQIALSSAGMNLFSGFSFLSLCKSPVSVPMINSLLLDSPALFIICSVLHIWSARSWTSGTHSGWIRISASGYSSFFSLMCRVVIRMWVMQWPPGGIGMIFLSGKFCFTCQARFTSGPKIMSFSSRDFTTFIAFADVHRMSASALASRRVLM